MHANLIIDKAKPTEGQHNFETTRWKQHKETSEAATSFFLMQQYAQAVTCRSPTGAQHESTNSKHARGLRPQDLSGVHPYDSGPFGEPNGVHPNDSGPFWEPKGVHPNDSGPFWEPTGVHPNDSGPFWEPKGVHKNDSGPFWEPKGVHPNNSGAERGAPKRLRPIWGAERGAPFGDSVLQTSQPFRSGQSLGRSEDFPINRHKGKSTHLTNKADPTQWRQA